MTGINKNTHSAFLIPLYRNYPEDNVFFFINKKSSNFVKLKNIFLQFGRECKI